MPKHLTIEVKIRVGEEYSTLSLASINRTAIDHDKLDQEIRSAVDAALEHVLTVTKSQRVLEAASRAELTTGDPF